VRSFRVAVIASGPAGVYAAALTERDEVSVDVIDRLPTPFGLVRYGVGPEPSSKSLIAVSVHRTTVASERIVLAAVRSACARVAAMTRCCRAGSVLRRGQPTQKQHKSRRRRRSTRR
jgi:hypothetical protein